MILQKHFKTLLGFIKFEMLTEMFSRFSTVFSPYLLFEFLHPGTKQVKKFAKRYFLLKQPTKNLKILY